MFFFKKYHFKIIIILFTILSGCQLQDHNNTHGIAFLENRANKLLVNITNKNDVIKIIGYPQIKDNEGYDNWIYIERTLSKGKYHELGKHKLKDNNVLILEFNKYGILRSKEFLTKEQINKIKFSKSSTKNNFTQKSFVQSFLESVKQKMYGSRGR